jgi:predicted PurR-regulated permease PerM
MLSDYYKKLKNHKKMRKPLRFLKKLGFKKSLPLIYLLLLFLGVILTFIYAFIPTFVSCSFLFGSYFCTPTGIFIALFASLPGYILSGNLLSFIKDLPWSVSFAVIILTSVVFYYLLGLFLDKFKSKSLNTESMSKIIIFVFFFILLIFFISLI